jgi:penicillin-binding protein 1A
MTRNRKTLLIALLFIGAIPAGMITGTFLSLTTDLPQIRSLESFKPSAVTRVYSADQVLLAELFAERRELVPLKVIPQDLKAAIIATEDRNFYRHSGVDVKGIFRAVLKDLWAREFVEGASTITQQLAKTLFLSPKKALVRKLKEALLAFQLERRYTKDEILEYYLNQVYFGSGAYGVESAAKIFFGKSVEALTLPECALIAGMPKAPSRYSPLVNIARAKTRRNIVLKQMKITGVISGKAYNEAMEAPVRLAGGKGTALKAPYFVAYIKPILEAAVGSSRLYREGLVVSTTLSYRLQEAAEKAVAAGLANLEIRMKKRGRKDPNPQSALVALDVKTGGVLAMVGGRDFQSSSFNRAVSARRQPGSAFKPIAFALAVERGFPQNRMLLDAPVSFRGAGPKKDWRPGNFSGKYKGEMTMREALALSQNIPAVRLIEKLGPDSVAAFAHQLGIDSPLNPNLTLVLGSSGITLTELTSAYASFSNRGRYVEPFGVVEIMDRSGRIMWRAKPKKKVVMSRAGAAIITNMLEAVVTEGTGRKARRLDRPVAGKTGTTNDCRDALFVGFSPGISTGVWVGMDNYQSLGRKETGAMAALPIWIDFMREALSDRPLEYFDIPDDVVSVRMERHTGVILPRGSSRGGVAFFKKDVEHKP